jgi:hypothetical protein
LEIATGLTSHHRGKFGQERSRPTAGRQQGRVCQDGDGLAAIRDDHGSSGFSGASDMFARRGVQFLDGDRTHAGTLKYIGSLSSVTV